MKNIIAIAILTAISNPLWAGSASLKPLELNSVTPQAITAVALPQADILPVRADGVTRDNWAHVKLYASDGAVITVDYTALAGGGAITASPVWVNVSGGRLGGGNKLRVVLMNYYDCAGSVNGKLESTQQIDLAYAGNGRYTGKAAKGVTLSSGGMGYGYTFRQELAVVVDGKWLSVANSGSNNFGFKMTWY